MHCDVIATKHRKPKQSGMTPGESTGSLASGSVQAPPSHGSSDRERVLRGASVDSRTPSPSPPALSSMAGGRPKRDGDEDYSPQSDNEYTPSTVRRDSSTYALPGTNDSSSSSFARSTSSPASDLASRVTATRLMAADFSSALPPAAVGVGATQTVCNTSAYDEKKLSPLGTSSSDV